MVDFDLRELSAPLEALRPEVAAAYKRLDAKWDEIAAQIGKLPIPCTVGYTFSRSPRFPDQSDRLEWRKWRGKRRFCITSSSWDDDPQDGPVECEDVTPYEEWSAEQRVQMLPHVPSLFENAVEQVKNFIDRTKNEEVDE